MFHTRDIVSLEAGTFRDEDTICFSFSYLRRELILELPSLVPMIDRDEFLGTRLERAPAHYSKSTTAYPPAH